MTKIINVENNVFDKLAMLKTQTSATFGASALNIIILDEILSEYIYRSQGVTANERFKDIIDYFDGGVDYKPIAEYYVVRSEDKDHDGDYLFFTGFSGLMPRYYYDDNPNGINPSIEQFGTYEEAEKYALPTFKVVKVTF